MDGRGQEPHLASRPGGTPDASNPDRSGLGHIRSLGCTALYLGPLFESTAHGYDTADYWHLDRRLGTDETLRRFVAAAHTAGWLAATLGQSLLRAETAALAALSLMQGWFWAQAAVENPSDKNLD